jgi:hypothetical protein
MKTKSTHTFTSNNRTGLLSGSLLFLFSFLTFLTAEAQQYQVIPVTGFNQDVIAEGVGTAGSHRALATTTTTFDRSSGVVSGADHVMYAKNFRGDNNLLTAPPYGLVDNGFIVSASDNNKRYQLANYTGNNTLLLVGNGSSGELTFSTSGCYSALSILASSGEAASSFNVTVNFSDGTTAPYSFSVPDWYNGSNYAIQGIGRVNRVPDGGADTWDTFSGDASNPRLYDCNMTISGVNLNKLVKSITVTKSDAQAGRTAILAVSGQISSTVPGTPVATAATSVAGTSFSANWNAVDNATKYFLDVSTSASFTSFVTGYNNLDAGNVTSKSVTGLSAGVAYFYRVRAANVNGQSFNSNTINVGGLSAPVATDATAKTSDSFSANWGSVAGATDYYLEPGERIQQSQHRKCIHPFHNRVNLGCDLLFQSKGQ